MLKEAFEIHGLPRRLYVDNGSAFSSELLNLACARSGISLCHSKPYDSPSRGKIERFFRTVRDRFLSGVGEKVTLDELNEAFCLWLKEDYHHRQHRGIELIVKRQNQFSYKDLQFHMMDSRTYRTFCEFGFADMVPSKTVLHRDISKIRAETLEAINRILLQHAACGGQEKGRKVRMDCTVTESNIHAPTDSSLLFDSVRVLCRITQKARESFGIEVTDHTRRAKRRAMGILNAKSEKKRLPLYKDLLRITAKVVHDFEGVLAKLTVLSSVSVLTVSGLCVEFNHYIPLAKQVIEQAERRVLKGEKLSPDEKLVSIFKPHTDIIRKDNQDTLYGHKLAFTCGASGLITDLIVWKGNPGDAAMATELVERQVEIYGRVPGQVAYDGGFASKANLAELKSMGVKDVMFSKRRGMEIGDMAKSTWVYKRLRDFRAGIEGMISFLKRCFGLRRCNWKGFESFRAYTWSSVLSANRLLLSRRLLA